MKQSPQVTVGIVGRQSLRFTLSGIYSTRDAAVVTGVQEVSLSEGGMLVEWQGRTYSSLEFTPTSYGGDSFELEGVTIGVNFHWQREESQRFRGTLRIIVEEGRLMAVNVVDVEDYLVSVISSEMKSTSSLPLLRAHAVISRSWLLAQMDHRECSSPRHRPAGVKDEIVRWWDHEDHRNYDVCADDHCQRYQGIGRVESAAAGAVADTRGEVLMHDGQLCDTRFSKCCGGVFELFSSCWEDDDKPYLVPRRDGVDPADFPDLTVEAHAAEWIEGDPEAFCRCADPRILAQVLNSYDREATDFYRWTVEYSRDELRRLVGERLERDLGYITSMRPLRRGPSGRIVRLEITGTLGRAVIGKELMIRRTLSDTHLRSSAFTVEPLDTDASGVPARFRLHGAGWGHGVGLCQIGAAVMGDRGYAYSDILAHYYPGSNLTKLY